MRNGPRAKCCKPKQSWRSMRTKAAVEAMERAQERLAEARTTANKAVQAQIDELNTEIDTLKEEAQEKAVETKLVAIVQLLTLQKEHHDESNS
jgi:predicted dinucleotide-utilizing enzyme